MRISTECRDPDLLAAEVRRLQAIIDAGEPCPYVTGTVTRYCTLTPFTLTDRERFVLREVRDIYAAADDTIRGIGIVSVIDALLERTKEVASDDNTQGDAASAGSTQPALYAVMHGGAVMEYCRDEDEAAESARRFSGSVVPLYRHDRDADLLLKIGRREQRIEGR